MQPTTLVDVLRPHCHEPVLPVTHVRTKLHDHVRKLVQVRPRPEVLYRFILENTDFIWRETVHFDNFKGLAIQLEGELEFL